jgi:hypothetical protein
MYDTGQGENNGHHTTHPLGDDDPGLFGEGIPLDGPRGGRTEDPGVRSSPLSGREREGERERVRNMTTVIHIHRSQFETQIQ